jgi:diguanylate cyclase (GGDEF)-like protein
MVTGHAMTDGYMEFPGLGWIVVARRPLLGALQAAREIVWMILALGTAVALLGVWLAIRLADRLSAPLRALAAEADRLGRAAGPASLSHHAGSAEVVRLSTTLRSLVRRLGSAERQTREAEQRASDVAGRLAADIRRLRQLADTDPLTGLLNRRAFLAAGNAAMVGAGPGGEGGEVAGVLLIDIDRFKQVNDRHGHAAGDTVIQQVSRLIGRSLRASDRVARFGGEEFVVLLGGTADALGIAALIRQTVAATPVAHGEVRIAVTVSIGVALPAARDRDIEDTIERADRGLYAAKNAGRDRVVLMPAEGPLPRVA